MKLLDKTLLLACVARGLLSLVSDDASFVTALAVQIDGGMSL
jgi:hypothetical protein